MKTQDSLIQIPEDCNEEFSLKACRRFIWQEKFSDKCATPEAEEHSLCVNKAPGPESLYTMAYEDPQTATVQSAPGTAPVIELC